MSSPRTRLTADDSTIYANVRAVAGIFGAYAFLFIILGAVLMHETGSASRPELQVAGGAALVLLGVSGLMGAVAILARKRRLASLIYGAVALKLLAFPIGTICSIYLVWRLPRYLQILEILETVGADDLSAIPTDQPGEAYFLQRYRRSRRWLYFFVLLLPFGLVGPCSISAVVPNREVRGVLAVCGIFLSITALSGGILMLNDLRPRFWSPHRADLIPTGDDCAGMLVYRHELRVSCGPVGFPLQPPRAGRRTPLIGDPQ